MTENRSVGGSIPPPGTMTFYPDMGGSSVPTSSTTWCAMERHGETQESKSWVEMRVVRKTALVSYPSDLSVVRFPPLTVHTG